MYSPVLVIFPDAEAAGPPWKQRPADYHPRDVNIFLANARARAAMVWKAPRFLYPLASFVNGMIDLIGRAFRPKGGPQIKDLLKRNVDTGRDRDVLDSGVRRPHIAWRRYHQIKQYYPRTCYVNVVRHDEDKIAIQYWFFYYFNDYWNRHQADFEVVTVFLKGSAGSLAPTGCYFGAHHDGAFRLWRDPDSQRGGGVLLAGETHPIAFVGRGSHAFYSSPTFPPRTPFMMLSKLGFLPLPFNMQVPMFNAFRRVSDDVVLMSQDEVQAAYVDPAVLTYDLRVIPPVDSIDPVKNPNAWNDFWWVRYKGNWGSGNWCRFPIPTQPGIHGMAHQERFSDPWGFLARCTAEIDWTDL